MFWQNQNGNVDGDFSGVVKTNPPGRSSVPRDSIHADEETSVLGKIYREIAAPSSMEQAA